MRRKEGNTIDINIKNYSIWKNKTGKQRQDIKKWSSDEIEKLINLAEEGKNHMEIAIQLNRSPYSVMSKSTRLKLLLSADENRLKNRLKYKHWNFDETKKAIAFLKQAMSQEEIAKKLNRTAHSTHTTLSYIKSALRAPRFGEDWREEELIEIVHDDYDTAFFASKWKRSIPQVKNKREIMLGIIKHRRLCSRPNILSRRDQIIKSLIETEPIADKIYDTVPKKHYVQNELYKLLSNVNCPILTLLGPTPERYINTLQQYNIIGKNFIYSNETDLDVFISVAKRFGVEKIENLVLTYGDVASASPQRLIDLDLMGRWSTQGSLIKRLFEKQRLMNGKKYFMFNISVMGEENLNIPTYIEIILEELLGVKSDVVARRISFVADDTSTLEVDKYEISTAPDYNVSAYRYADTSPMLNLLIQY